MLPAPNGVTPPSKFLVAVHGIGDQIEYATVQSVVVSAGKYCGTLSSVPLGSFYPTPTGTPGVNTPIAPEPQILADVGGLGFGEVYWAGIARDVSRNGYILEETKKWARSIVARLAVSAAGHQKPMPVADRFRIVTILDELIETIAVLDRLTLVADKAGLFKFQLKTLLDNFVGDVQIVADFGAYRERILGEFTRVMEQVLAVAGCPDPDKSTGPLPEIYLIGHSEGSVVTFTALLTALSARRKYPWIDAIKGVMTIGSPIEVHHLLWPKLWQSLKPDAGGAGVRIPWCNYLDHGDPIAYELRATREWMQQRGFDRSLNLREFAFSRSFVPGKAHTDYWTDDAVFGHFFDTVVDLPRDRPNVPKPADPVPDRRLAQVSSYVLPQVLVAALHFLATYILYRAIYAALAPDAAAVLTVPDVARDVFGIGLLLLGITAVARIPRLTTSPVWRAVSVAMLVAAMAAYAWTTSIPTRSSLGDMFGSWATEGVLLVALMIALISGWLGFSRPKTGVRALPILGLIGTFGLVGAQLAQVYSQDQTAVSIWPVVLASAAFFYLWWLGALLFDLVFVWNVHVRFSKAADQIETIVTQGYVEPPKAIRHSRSRPGSRTDRT